MGQDLLGVLEPLLHLRVVMLEGNRDTDTRDLGFFVSVSDHFRLRTQFDLGLVLEVYLDKFVTEPEHDCVSRFHPLLQVD